MEKELTRPELKDGTIIKSLIKEHNINILSITSNALIWHTKLLSITSRGQELGAGFDGTIDRPKLKYNDALIASMVIALRKGETNNVIFLTHDKDFATIKSIFEENKVQYLYLENPEEFARSKGWNP